VNGPFCPCGERRQYRECCGRYIRGEAAAPTAEALMRSRYTGYVRRDEAYLLRTWHPSTRPATLELDETLWVGLEVLDTEAGGDQDTSGVVEFVARYLDANKAVATLHESSRFTHEGGEWLYIDGDVEP
jgi:SEC-C motif-containing protein